MHLVTYLPGSFVTAPDGSVLLLRLGLVVTVGTGYEHVEMGGVVAGCEPE